MSFDPLDVGPLWFAPYTEPFAQLVGELAYSGEDGPAEYFTGAVRIDPLFRARDPARLLSDEQYQA